MDVFISRDLDSRFQDRQEAAVKEWLQSEKSFHFMRDHPAHNNPILGSSWGCKMTGKNVRENWAQSWKDGFKSKLTWVSRDSYGQDQQFLDK